MASFRSAPGASPSVWGLVNGVTHMVDHVQGRTLDSRLNSAMFGTGSLLKNKAWDKAESTILEMV